MAAVAAYQSWAVGKSKSVNTGWASAPASRHPKVRRQVVTLWVVVTADWYQRLVDLVWVQSVELTSPWPRDLRELFTTIVVRPSATVGTILGSQRSCADTHRGGPGKKKKRKPSDDLAH